MKIQKHPWIDGVFIAVGPATLQATLGADAEPQSYPKADGTTTQYHWLDVAVKDNNGEMQTGGAMLPHKLFTKNPSGYSKDTTINVAIQLNGDGEGYCQVHLGNGRFAIANLVSQAELDKYSISTASKEDSPVKETA